MTTDTIPLCDICEEPLTIEGDGDGDAYGDPRHVFCDLCGEAEHPADMTTDWNGETGCHLSCEADPERAAYIAHRRDETLSYGDIAYAQSQGWCSSSPDGMGPHIPDDTTDPVTCAECGQNLADLNMEEPE